MFKNVWFLIFFWKNTRCRKQFTRSILCNFGSSTAKFFFFANIPYSNCQIKFQSSHLTKKETEDASNRLSTFCMGALNWRTPPRKSKSCCVFIPTYQRTDDGEKAQKRTHTNIHHFFLNPFSGRFTSFSVSWHENLKKKISRQQSFLHEEQKFKYFFLFFQNKKKHLCEKIIIFPPHRGSYVFLNIFFCFELFLSEYSEKFKKSRNVVYSWHLNVCVRVCVFVCVLARVTLENSSFCISGITLHIERKFGVHLKQARPFYW